MSDPTVEARAKAMRYISKGFAGVSLGYAAEADAREALAPIREWHQKQSQRLADRYSSEALMLKAQLAEIAPLIYPTEELEP